MTDKKDETKWSTRYYRTECPDILLLMKTDGPDDRSDPRPDATLECIVEEHGEHPLQRISPDEWKRLNDEEWDDEDDIDD